MVVRSRLDRARCHPRLHPWTPGPPGARDRYTAAMTAPTSDSAELSSLRELIPSFPNTLLRCHSTTSSSSGAASLPKPEAKATWPRTRFTQAQLKLAQRSTLRDPGEPKRVLTGARKMIRLCGRQRALAPARNMERQLYRALEKRSRRGLTPRARARAAESSSSSATASSGPAEARTRCHARRSGSAAGSVAAAIAACARRRSSEDPTQ